MAEPQLRKSLEDKIRAFALGDIHRANARTADCYAFTVDADGKSWSGGWDWSRSLVDKGAEFVFMLATGEIVRRKCAECRADVDALTVFPQGRCLACHEKAMQGKPIEPPDFSNPKILNI